MNNNQEKIVNRLSRLEGQIRGIRGMVESGENCQKIIIQVMAAKEACSKVGLEIMKSQLCSNKKIKKGELESLFRIIK